jgi:LPXTG-site transpeptidase (sortase) family protein
MAFHLRTAGRADARPVADSRRRRLAGAVTAAGFIALAIGFSVLALALAPMFVAGPSDLAVATRLGLPPALAPEAATVVAPSVAPPTVAAVSPAMVANPIDGRSFEMRIPAIGYMAMVHQGVSLGVLEIGPGHYPSTPWPGQGGNAGVAGHNTPWLGFNRLKAGDRIEIRTEHALYVYELTGTRVVDPNDVSVLAPTQDSRLTMTTCYPLWAGALATKRLAFIAKAIT